MPNDSIEGFSYTQYPDEFKRQKMVTPVVVSPGGIMLDPAMDTGDISVSVSTSFHPAASLRGAQSPDLLLLTSDSVFFYVHAYVLIDASNNRFGAIIPSFPSTTDGQPMVAHASLTSNVLNLLLHALYRMPCAHFTPSFEDVSTAFYSCSALGIRINEYVYPDSPLFEVAMSHAPTIPLDVFALAASLDLYQLATATSPHLLSVPVSAITDDLAARIGPLYLKRLVTLHLTRTEKLKQLFLTPPAPHFSNDECTCEELSRAWSFATANLAWDIRPDLSTAMIKSALSKGEAEVTCPDCQECLRARIDQLVEEWLQENVNIPPLQLLSP